MRKRDRETERELLDLYGVYCYFLQTQKGNGSKTNWMHSSAVSGVCVRSMLLMVKMMLLLQNTHHFPFFVFVCPHVELGCHPKDREMSNHWTKKSSTNQIATFNIVLRTRSILLPSYQPLLPSYILYHGTYQVPTIFFGGLGARTNTQKAAPDTMTQKRKVMTLHDSKR